MANGSGSAYWTGKARDPVRARDQLAALFPIRQRMIGAEHPDSLTTRYRLAIATGEAGDPAGARDQLTALLRASAVTCGLQPELPAWRTRPYLL
jgi:hypothetical protein